MGDEERDEERNGERVEPQESQEREERAEDGPEAEPGGDGSGEAGRATADDTAGGVPHEQGEQKVEKRVDEDWKAEARREKEQIDEKLAKEEIEKARKEAERRAPPPADFLHFVSGIAAQVLMQLGEIENPIAGKKAVDLTAARYSIDILQMLQEKTKGNLTPEEGRYMKAALHDLRMRFVGAATGGPEKETKPEPGAEPD